MVRRGVIESKGKQPHDRSMSIAIANRADTYRQAVPPDEQRDETTGDGQRIRGHETSKQATEQSTKGRWHGEEPHRAGGETTE